MLDLKERIRRSFSPPLFPIDLQDTPAKVTFHDVPSTPWSIGDALLTASLVVHPGPTVGFRIDADGASVAYLPDHEPALAGTVRGAHARLDLGRLIAQDVDLLLHDAQYFEEEYDERLGWGHSSVRRRGRLRGRGRRQAARPLPSRPDALGRDHAAARRPRPVRSVADGEDPPTIAREGMVLDLTRR